jgi:chorismate synthase
MSNVPRPSHADFTYQEKYQVKASSGGGRSSARETIGNSSFSPLLSSPFSTPLSSPLSFLSSSSCHPSYSSPFLTPQLGRVAAGAIAEKWLKQKYGIEIVGWVSSIADVVGTPPNEDTITRGEVDASRVRCPDPEASLEMVSRIEAGKDGRRGRWNKRKRRKDGKTR